ncbi:TAP-like protein-domain-containing protein [Xylariales sp. PMI_506]|nr:TAP-like protein-domain-containing protein [Xylariales sp. PMI_506]
MWASDSKTPPDIPLDSVTRRSPRRHSLLGLAIAGCFLWYYLSRVFPDARGGYEIFVPTVGHFKEEAPGWLAIAPSKDLDWKLCYDGKYDCARLSVPLDWLDPSEEERVILAVIRLKAKANDDYRGPVFINPGGPGGSGVSWLLRIADQMQTIVGDNHDIISWDPRGIGSSVPRIECWGSSQKRHEWDALRVQVLDSHPGIIYDAYAQALAYSRQCETYIEAATPNLLKHVATISHARDMLEISKKAGFDKVKYWGVSYGTILGGEFAAHFPANVERLVSDGNVYYKDWYLNNEINFLEDADKIMEAFFTFCHAAGPAKCGFYAHTPEAIEERFFALLEHLKKQPVAMTPYTAYNQTQPVNPELITYAKVQLLVRTCLYKPIVKFPLLANALAALEAGDGVLYYEMVYDSEEDPFLEACAAGEIDPNVPLAEAVSSSDAFPAIMCSDGDPFTETPDSFIGFAEKLQRISRFAGASNGHFKLSCAGRQTRPKWRGSGPLVETETAFPILFIGNIADNVTPLQSARNNSAMFPGSAVLVQRSYGHASIAAPSTCSAGVIRAYFQNGTLPAEDTYCDQDYELFGEPPVLSYGTAEDNLARAVLELSQMADLAPRF